MRSLCQVPTHSTYSPGVMEAAEPITVTSSRRPLTLTRRTQKPDSSLWKVTRSTEPERRSIWLSALAGFTTIFSTRTSWDGHG